MSENYEIGPKSDKETAQVLSENQWERKLRLNLRENTNDLVILTNRKYNDLLIDYRAKHDISR